MAWNKNNYQPPSPKDWNGREVAPEFGVQYWYQAVACAHLDRKPAQTAPDIALLGYAIDEGVGRNQGRVGAAEGPSAIRRCLGKLAYHMQELNISDFGDIVCYDHHLEAAQASFAMAIGQLMEYGIFPIGLGGGHDIAYAHAKGLLSALKHKLQRPRLGILNFDAHFDLRASDGVATSGTPFYQLLEEFPTQITYCCLGIQRESNSPDLFEIAQKNQVDFYTLSDCEMLPITKITTALDGFLTEVDYLYITIDMDGFSSALAPGVSAPSPWGLSPRFVQDVLAHVFASKKVVACDIAELNPVYDQDGATARLAARFVAFISEQINRILQR